MDEMLFAIIVSIVSIIFLSLCIVLLVSLFSGKLGDKRNADLQVGSTCGIYSMAFVYKKLVNCDATIQEMCGKIVPEIINQNISYVGEIFSVEKFLNIWNDFFSNKISCSAVINNPENMINIITSDLTQNQGKCLYIIPSCLSTNVPHYFVMWKENDTYYQWEGNKGLRICCLEELINKQSNMMTEYDFEQYFSGWLVKKVLTYLYQFILLFRNKKLYCFLIKNDIKLNKKLKLNKETLISNIDLHGTCFRIGF